MTAPPTAFQKMRANREKAELRALIDAHPFGFVHGAIVDMQKAADEAHARNGRPIVSQPTCGVPFNPWQLL